MINLHAPLLRVDAAGKAYLCMGQLDEADSQYRRALELEPSNASIKAEAQLVDAVRSNLRLGRQCLEEGDARRVPTSNLVMHLLYKRAMSIFLWSFHVRAFSKKPTVDKVQGLDAKFSLEWHRTLWVRTLPTIAHTACDCATSSLDFL